MDIYAKPGTLVTFTALGGHKSQKREAKKILKLGADYIVERIEIHDWSSSVWLEGFDHAFNTTLFEEVG